MTDYGGWTREQLIERLHDFEAKAAQHDLQSSENSIAQRRDRTALQDREARLQAILDTAVEGIITIDERGRIESCNQASEEIFGYAATEMIGRNVNMLMPEPYRTQHDSYLANYLNTGHARIIGIGREVIGLRKDGTSFPMELSVSEVKLDSGRLFTGFVRDISERKRLEKEVLEISERERRSIGQGLHDGLCQQLAGIELMSQVLEQKLLRKKGRASRATEASHLAEQAGKISRHVRESISQTRSLARGFSPVGLDADGLITALEELAGTICDLFQVRCRFECGDRILMQDNGAATHLYRIAQEAAHNAIKHGKAREVVIYLDREEGGLRLAIRDNGKGFPETIKSHSGMGLQIMKYRASMIGGTLEIRSTKGKGAVVVCRSNPASMPDAACPVSKTTSKASGARSSVRSNTRGRTRTTS